MSSNKVWVTGDAVVDLIPHGDNCYLKCPGGAPANVAVGISRLGGYSSFLGRVGDDPLGYFIKEVLNIEKVDTQYMRLDNQYRTSTVIVDLDNKGERDFTFMVKPSADQFFDEGDIPEFIAGQWLHCCSIALANEPSRSATFSAIHRMKNVGGYVSFDPNIREDIWVRPSEIRSVVMDAIQLADVVKFSEEEITFLTNSKTLDDALLNLGDLSEKLILVTLGANGVLSVYNGARKVISGDKVDKVVDTTGAGDAFVGGVLAKLSQKNQWQTWDHIESAIHWGNRCGALVITKKGAMTALPFLEQLL